MGSRFSKQTQNGDMSDRQRRHERRKTRNGGVSATDDHNLLQLPKDSLQFPGLSLCRLCKDLEHQLELQGSGRAPDRVWGGFSGGPPVIASHGQISSRQGLQSIRQGRIEGCEMCTVLTTCIDAFAAAMLDGHALAAFMSFDMIDYLHPLVPNNATIRLSKADLDPPGMFLQLELVREPYSGQAELRNAQVIPPARTTGTIPIQLDLCSAASTIKRWCTDCTENHTTCTAPNVPLVMPDRVLDVSPRSDGSIRLVENLDECASYIALSYCWGDAKAHWSTTTSNLDRQKTNISHDSIPGLFKDVVRICQALKIRYLWIDSLCVVQDSIEDWDMQAAKMASIYSNALFTIAASTSYNPSQGLFVNRWTTSVAFQREAATLNGEVTLPEKTRLHYASGSVRITRGLYSYRLGPTDLISHRIMASTGLILDREEAPLFTRAWAFQERVLSTRIVYFLPSELVWECNSGFSCECGNMEGINSSSLNHNRYLGDLQTETSPSPLQGTKLRRVDRCNEWQRLVTQYTSLHLSFESDRIAAFSGIAARYAEDSVGHYVAGTWTDMLPAALCWSIVRRTAATSANEQDHTAKAPSWSWASVRLSRGDSVHYRHAIGLSEMACSNFKIISTETSLSGKNPYGGVDHSTLTVQALCFDCAPGSVRYHNRTCLAPTDIDAQPVWSPHVQDFIIDHDLWFRGTAGILVMYLGWERGLVLMEAKNETTGATVYRRLGIALLYTYMCGKLQRYTDLRQITLV